MYLAIILIENVVVISEFISRILSEKVNLDLLNSFVAVLLVLMF